MSSRAAQRGYQRVLGQVAAVLLVASACSAGDQSAAEPAGSEASGTDAAAVDDAPDATDTGATDTSADDATEATDDPGGPANPTDTPDGEDGEDGEDGDRVAASPVEGCQTFDVVSLQLQWFTQAQFAGYYAAQAHGFYGDRCLHVNIVEGGVDIVPQRELADGNVDFALAWVPKALASREAGAHIVNIGQIFQRSGTLQVSFADRGIVAPVDFAGRVIGQWGSGNEYEVFAALAQSGLDPAVDVTLVEQNFDMSALLSGEIDAAEAMTYNEYAQVLEAVNPATGELYQPEDFNVISYEDVGVGMLQDAIWADADRLATDEAYRDIAIRFVAASMQGWIYCRDNVTACADIVLAAGPTLRASHQRWEMNEVNQLVWPSPEGIGYITQDAWDRTVEISLGTPNLDGTTVLSDRPSGGAFDNSIVEAAWELLSEGADTIGDDYVPIEVTLNEGGN